MRAFRYRRILCFILAACFIDVYDLTDGGGGYCSFPRFLWQHEEGGTERKWNSRTEYDRNTDTWTKQKSIRAKETEIWISSRMHASCNGAEPEGAIPCFRQEVVYRIICVSEEPNDKFRTQQNLNGKLTFSCLKFVRRTDSIVQLFQAAPNEINEDRLCYDISLQRDDWPWIDSGAELRRPRSCFFSAGFNLATILGDNRQRLCSSEWLPSRLEKQCDLVNSRESSVRFYYPHADCSPFFAPTHEQKLICWSEWREETFTFIVLSDEDKALPRYVLRLPNFASNTTQSFNGHLYFSIVAPLSGRGTPPGNVMFVDMHLHRSDSGACFDESDDCDEMAAAGKCSSRPAGLRQTSSSSSSSASSSSSSYMSAYQPTSAISSHCLRSCKLCDDEAMRRPGCGFPAEFLGDWVGFSAHLGTVEISIATAEIRSVLLNATLVCKGMHWDLPYFKVLAVRDNGCRPRYCCLDLSISGGEQLNYRIAGCSFSDESFHNCEGASLPLNRVHFMRKPSVRLSQCGFSGSFLVSITFVHRLTCNGTLTNIDDATCEDTPSLKFNLRSCHHLDDLELSCVAYGQMSPGTRLLMTRSPEDARFSCWSVHSMSSLEGDDGNLRGGGFLLKRCSSWDSQEVAAAAASSTLGRSMEPVLIQAFPSYIDSHCSGRFFNRPKSPADQPQISRGAALEGSRAPLPPYRATPPSWTGDDSPVHQRPAPLHDFDTNSSPRRRQEPPGVYSNAVAMDTRCGCCWLVIVGILQMVTNFLYVSQRRTTVTDAKAAAISDCL